MIYSVQNQILDLVIVGKVWIRNQIVSHGFPENLSNYEAYPPQGLSEARRDRNVYRNVQSQIRREGFPFAAAESITTELYPNPSERRKSFRNVPVDKFLF
jgi:hypothetical protein